MDKERKSFLTAGLAIISLVFVLGVFSIGLSNTCNGCEFDDTNVAPFCESCGDRDGIRLHECTNPDGESIFCRECGKIKIRIGHVGPKIL